MVTRRQLCLWPGCSNPAGPAHFVYGRAYCPQHYFPGIESALVETIRQLKEGQPSTKFRSLLKRYIEALLNEKGAPPGLAKLTASQIEGRAVLSHISEEEVTFSIERHGSFIPVTYYFQLSIKDKEFKQLSCEPHYIGVDEFTERFGLSTAKVRSLIKAGRLKAIRASQVQEQWYRLMLESGRPFVPKPWDPNTPDFTPKHAYLIPFTEVKRFSQLGGLNKAAET